MIIHCLNATLSSTDITRFKKKIQGTIPLRDWTITSWLVEDIEMIKKFEIENFIKNSDIWEWHYGTK